VVRGPQTILLNYEETLEVLSLSTGTPKSDKTLFQTVYLCVVNNEVSDSIVVQTADHVEIIVKLIYKNIDFIGDDPTKWFEVENYVKHLTDHCRSVVKAAVKKISVKDFYAEPIDHIRNIVLGERREDGRRGMVFKENNMVIQDVDVLDVEIGNRDIKQLLDEAQKSVVHTNIVLENDQRNLAYIKEREAVKQKQIEILGSTKVVELAVARQELAEKHSNELLALENQSLSDSKQLERQINNSMLKLNIVANEVDASLKTHQARIQQQTEVQALELGRIEAETSSYVQRTQALSPKLATAIESLTEAVQFKALIKEFGDQAIINGQGILETTKKVLDFLPDNFRLMKQIGNGKRQSQKQ
jgi:major vault protein